MLLCRCVDVWMCRCIDLLTHVMCGCVMVCQLVLFIPDFIGKTSDARAVLEVHTTHHCSSHPFTFIQSKHPPSLISSISFGLIHSRLHYRCLVSCIEVGLATPGQCLRYTQQAIFLPCVQLIHHPFASSLFLVNVCTVHCSSHPVPSAGRSGSLSVSRPIMCL